MNKYQIIAAVLIMFGSLPYVMASYYLWHTMDFLTASETHKATLGSLSLSVDEE